MPNNSGINAAEREIKAITLEERYLIEELLDYAVNSVTAQ